MAAGSDPVASLLSRLGGKDYPGSPSPTFTNGFGAQMRVKEASNDPKPDTAIDSASVSLSQSPPKGDFTFSFKNSRSSTPVKSLQHPQPPADFPGQYGQPLPELAALRTNSRNSIALASSRPSSTNIAQPVRLAEASQSPKLSTVEQQPSSCGSQHASAPHSPDMAASNVLLSQLLDRTPQSTNSSVPISDSTPTLSKKQLKKLRKQENGQDQAARSPSKQSSMPVKQVNGIAKEVDHSTVQNDASTSDQAKPQNVVESSSSEGVIVKAANGISTPPPEMTAAVEKMIKKQLQGLGDELPRKFESQLQKALSSYHTQVQTTYKSSGSDQKSHVTNVIKATTSSLGEKLRADIKQLLDQQSNAQSAPGVSPQSKREMQVIINDLLPPQLKASLKAVLPKELATNNDRSIDATLDALTDALPEIIESSLTDAVGKTLRNPEIITLISRDVMQRYNDWLEDKIQRPARNFYSSLAEAMEEQALKIANVIITLSDTIQKQNDDITDLRGAYATSTETLEKTASMFKTAVEAQKKMQEQTLQCVRDQAAELASLKSQLSEMSLALSSQSATPESGQRKIPDRDRSAPALPLPQAIVKIQQLVDDKEYEKAIIEWSKSEERQEIFRRVWVKSELKDFPGATPQLYVLAALIAATENLSDFLTERLTFALKIVRHVDVKQPETVRILRHTMEQVRTRVEAKGREMDESGNGDDVIVGMIGNLLMRATTKLQQAEIAIDIAKLEESQQAAGSTSVAKK